MNLEFQKYFASDNNSGVIPEVMEALSAIKNHVLDKASLTGTYTLNPALR